MAIERSPEFGALIEQYSTKFKKSIIYNLTRYNTKRAHEFSTMPTDMNLVCNLDKRYKRVILKYFSTRLNKDVQRDQLFALYEKLLEYLLNPDTDQLMLCGLIYFAASTKNLPSKLNKGSITKYQKGDGTSTQLSIRSVSFYAFKYLVKNQISKFISTGESYLKALKERLSTMALIESDYKQRQTLQQEIQRYRWDLIIDVIPSDKIGFEAIKYINEYGEGIYKKQMILIESEFSKLDDEDKIKMLREKRYLFFTLINIDSMQSPWCHRLFEEVKKVVKEYHAPSCPKCNAKLSYNFDTGMYTQCYKFGCLPIRVPFKGPKYGL